MKIGEIVHYETERIFTHKNIAKGKITRIFSDTKVIESKELLPNGDTIFRLVKFNSIIG